MLDIGIHPPEHFSVSPLEEFLNNRDARDLAPFVAGLYRWLPAPFARVVEKRLMRRHMRSIAANISFRRTDDGGWHVRRGRECIARALPLERLVALSDQPVTIVATGPSAKQYPWDSLRDGSRFVIAVAGAPTLLKEAGVKPDLFVVSDSRLARRGIGHFRNAPGVPLVTVPRGASFLAVDAPEELTGRPFSLIEQINSWYDLPQLSHAELLDLNRRSGAPFHFAEVPDPHYRCGWSDAPELGYFSAATVTFVALQIAVRLGARDVEIIGMDLSSAPRAYNEGGKPLPNSLEHHYQSVILPSFGVMRKVLQDRGVSVRNLSPVCPLPASLFG